jgi:hypothetical protein
LVVFLGGTLSWAADLHSKKQARAKEGWARRRTTVLCSIGQAGMQVKDGEHIHPLPLLEPVRPSALWSFFCGMAPEKVSRTSPIPKPEQSMIRFLPSSSPRSTCSRHHPHTPLARSVAQRRKTCRGRQRKPGPAHASVPSWGCIRLALPSLPAHFTEMVERPPVDPAMPCAPLCRLRPHNLARPVARLLVALPVLRIASAAAARHATGRIKPRTAPP